MDELVVWAMMCDRMRRRVLDLIVAECSVRTLHTLAAVPEGAQMIRWLLTTDEQPVPIDA